MSCTNEESSSTEFIYQNRKRTNEKIMQEFFEKQMTPHELRIKKRIENDIENNRLRRTESVN